MGYLLPIKPIQSEQYANRMNMGTYNFAYIGRAQRVQLQSDFLDDFKEKQKSEEEEREGKEELSFVPAPNSYQGYIQPNPANLSPIIAQVVGKGITVNTYV